MATLYLIEQNTILRKTSERLLLCRKPAASKKSSGYTQNDILLELPCSDVEQVMLFGNVQVTTQALQHLLRHSIELAIFTRNGKLLGQLTPPASKNIHLRIAQYEKLKDHGFRLQFARTIVTAKLNNALTLLKNHAWNHPGLFETEEFKAITERIQAIEQATSMETIRGCEGAGAAVYFKLFSRMFIKPWHFTKRTRRPPKDPVNAVLSYGYTIVGAELQSILDGIGFDPFLGFYHSIHYGRPALALDLLEEYRQPLIDRLVLNLFNLQKLQDGDFLKTEKDGIYLNASGKRKFFTEYEKMLGNYLSQLEHAESTKSFRTFFQIQARTLAKAVKGECDYRPFNAS